jgi:head-tail adaptor
MPAIGALRHEVDLIAIVRTDDGAGGWTRADTTILSVDADVRPASWSQQQRALRLEQRISHVIVIRWDPDILDGIGPESRARFTDNAGRVRELAVKTIIDPDERGVWLELGCAEGGPL